MRKFPTTFFYAVLLSLLLPLAAVSQLLPHAHSHNDYEHKRPLFDALDYGFCSVEADIFLINGQLLVAHDKSKTNPDRTLQTLYLDPLQKRAKQKGGKIFPSAPEFFLLIDIKSDANKIYPVLRDTLKKYADMLTTFSDGKTETKAVTIILTGNRPKELLAAEKVRYAALDGRIEDLVEKPDPLILWLSDSWPKNFSWRGTGPLDLAEKRKLEGIVSKAHQRNWKVRFWATPDQPHAWRELLSMGVDIINSDDLAGLRDFFKSPGRY